MLPRDIYNCEIFSIPIGICNTKKTFKYNKEDLPLGKGFFWVLKVLDGKYKHTEITDYFFLEYNPLCPKKKDIDYTRLKDVLNALNMKKFKSNDLEQFIGQKIQVLINTKLNQNEEPVNYVEKYVSC